jgi:hypothetical protein
MTRVCSVCTHPQRQAIDKALIAAATPYRHIASRYALTTTALQRHKADHLLATIWEAWQRERADNGAELADDLRGWMDRLTKLLDACDAWLTDPDDPTRYDLNPRSHEVWVHYEAPVAGPVRPLLVESVVAAARAVAESSGRAERMALLAAVRRLNEHDGIGDSEEEGDGEAAVIIQTGQRFVRRKARLSELLALVDGAEVAGDVTLVEHKSADPRKLIIDASKALEGHLRLLGELVGKLQTIGTVNFLISPEWLTLRGRMLAALAHFPEARLALAGALEGDGTIEGEWQEAAD